MESSKGSLVTFEGGFVADAVIVKRLLEMQARGIAFQLLPNKRFRVRPVDRLTLEDARFLRTRRDEVREYVKQTRLTRGRGTVS